MPVPTTVQLGNTYTVIGDDALQTPPAGRTAPLLPSVIVGPVTGVRMTLKSEAPPQLSPIAVRVYAPGGRIDCGMTVSFTGLLNPDLR